MPLKLPEQHRSKASWWPRALFFSLSLRFAGSCVSEKAVFSKAEAGKRNTLEVYVPSWIIIRRRLVIVLRETVKIACVCGWCNLKAGKNKRRVSEFLVKFHARFKKIIFYSFLNQRLFFWMSLERRLVVRVTVVSENRQGSCPHGVYTLVWNKL